MTLTLKACEYWIRNHMNTNDKVAWSFIDKNEGLAKQGYVPCDSKGNVLGHSGCTVGAGFDIGNETVSAMTTYQFSADLLKRLLPYCDKTGVTAKDFLVKYPLYLSGGDTEEIDTKVHTKFFADLAALFNANSELSFEDLDSKKQTVVMSVFYQYGNLKVHCPNFFKAIVNGWWKEAVDELRNFGDAYPTRRGLEADLLTSSL